MELEIDCSDRSVSEEEFALEIGYGILGRAMDIHENPDDEYEELAEELKKVSNEILDQYE